MTRITAFVGPDVAAHPLMTALDREVITEDLYGRVFWCADPSDETDNSGRPPSFELATLAARVLARRPEAVGTVVLVGMHAANVRDWLRPHFPSVPICAVGTDLDWPGPAQVLTGIDAAVTKLARVEVKVEPW